MIIIWIVAIVIFVVIEAATIQLVSIWFGIAAIVALIVAALGAEIWLQVVVFIVVAALLLILTRPIVKRLQKKSPGAKTNADRVIGEQAVVLKAIDNDRAEGQVKVLGQIWTARSENGAKIPAGQKVVVQAIQGVKVIVSEPVTADVE